MWELELFLSVDFLVIQFKSSLWKAHYYRLLCYMVLKDWKSAYYFILHQVLLLCVIFIIFLRYKTIFCTYHHFIVLSSNYFILNLLSSHIFNPYWFWKSFNQHKTAFKRLFLYWHQALNSQAITGVVNFSDQYWCTVVIRAVWGKPRQYTTVPSQCEYLTYFWSWRYWYFNQILCFENLPIIVYYITCSWKN